MVFSYSHTTRRCLVRAVLVLGILDAPAIARDQARRPEVCTISLADAPITAPRFDDYPAAAGQIARPAPLDISSGHETRLWRTVLRLAESGGPNFAGYYTIARLGCGAGCAGLAVIDARNGRATFPANLRTVEDLMSDGDRLTFRMESRLLAVVGVPNEVESRNGIAFYVWTGKAMKLVRAYSYAQLCAAKKVRTVR